MTYSDLIRIKNLGETIINNPLYKPVVTKGLVLWVDGKDFKNSPPTNLLIDRAKPNAIAYNNLFPNGDFALDSNSDGLADGLILYSGGIDGITGCSIVDKQQIYTPARTYGGIAIKYKGNNNDKIYVTCQLKTDPGLTRAMSLSINRSPWTGASVTLTEKYTKYFFIYTSTGIEDQIVWQDPGISDWAKVYLKEPLIINLTLLFGAGNEPSLSECNSIFSFTSSNAVAMRGNNAIPIGFAYIPTSGAANGDIVLEGVDDHFSCGNALSLQPSPLQDYTLECTIKTLQSVRADIVRKFDSLSTAGYDLAINRDGVGNLSVVIGNSATIVSSGITINDGTKKHICCTISNGVQKLYVNGMVVGTASFTSYNIASTVQSLYIGATDTGANPLAGSIFNVRIYNRVLTSKEVEQNYKESR
jgi:hypothetical protein